MTAQTIVQQPGLLILVFAILSLAPFLLITATSFVKLSAVFSILRSAMGTPSIPPNTVITGLALILTIIIMMPVGTEIAERMDEDDITLETITQTKDMIEIFDILEGCVRAPLAGFLLSHAHEEELAMMSEMVAEENSKSIEDYNIIVLIAAFVLSELKEAFQIGFLLFLPFIIIDMVVANILQALGMVMLSPTTLSLPFKLLLFVLADGWYLVVEGLIAGYR